jgi:hypothetical protein
VIIIESHDAPKSILETEKTLKTFSSGQIYKKKQKTIKTIKTHWAGFKKKPGFFQPCLQELEKFAKM